MATSARGLGEHDVVGTQPAGCALEQAEGADHPAAQPHRDRVGGYEADLQGLGCEGPPFRGDRQIGEIDTDARGAGAVAVHARALVVLEGEKFQHVCALVGGGDGHEPVLLVGEQDSRRLDVEEFHAALTQLLQEFDDTEIIGQRVGDLHEHLGQSLHTRHGAGPSLRPKLFLSSFSPSRRRRSTMSREMSPTGRPDA